MLHDDRNAEEGFIFGLATTRAVKEVRVLRDRGNDDGLAGLYDAARNALAHLVAALARLAT